MYAPVVDVHWVTVKQLAYLEPTLVEVVACMIGDLLNDALQETVHTVGVPEPAARAMLLGHIQVALANGLRGDNPFSDACLIAMDYGREKIIKDDWKSIFNDDELDHVLKQMLHLDTSTAEPRTVPTGPRPGRPTSPETVRGPCDDATVSQNRPRAHGRHHRCGAASLVLAEGRALSIRADSWGPLGRWQAGAHGANRRSTRRAGSLARDGESASAGGGPARTVDRRHPDPGRPAVHTATAALLRRSDRLVFPLRCRHASLPGLRRRQHAGPGRRALACHQVRRAFLDRRPVRAEPLSARLAFSTSRRLTGRCPR